jgi:hypothetical protein
MPKEYFENQIMNLFFCAHVLDFLSNVWKIINFFKINIIVLFFATPKPRIFKVLALFP